MLQQLFVRNYALIEELELSFNAGFSVITGETGAGKSILLGALGLILGKRADLKALRDPQQKCVVEGSFLLNADRFAEYFDAHDLDFESPTIIRREISPAGKSRAFVNDTPVKLNVLTELADRLIDVHSQHQNLLLADSDFQMELIDSFAENDHELEDYCREFKNRRRIKKEIQNLSQSFEGEVVDLDYLKFLFQELEEADLRPAEQEELEEELKMLSNSEEISELLSASLSELSDNASSGINDRLSNLHSRVDRLARLHSGFEELAERVNSLMIEAQDLESELQQQSSTIEYDPARVQQLDSRLSELIRLQAKNKVDNLEALIARRDELAEKLQNLEGLDEKKLELENELRESESNLRSLAETLRKSRTQGASRIESRIQSILEKLNMPEARLAIQIEADAQFLPHGMDQISFQFTANPGSKAQPLSKVASGGEMSRVMLALKSSMASKNELPSIIFDEIDTGVSGETAGKIGEILKEMGSSMQVIAISHLPQISSMGAAHYKVSKSTSDGQTFTRITALNEEERVRELARLLSGSEVTEAALANAKNLLAQQ